MLTEDVINKIIGHASEAFKKANAKTYSNKDAKQDAWGEAYEYAVEEAQKISVHCEIGKFPRSLMRDKAPNETAEEMAYREACFESITVPYWHRAEGSTNRIFASQNHTIDYGTEESQEYFTEDYPIYGSAINFFQSVVNKQKIRYPNAVLAVDFEVPKKKKADGTEETDQSVELTPYGTIYDTSKVLMYEDGQYCLVLTEHKSMVKVGNDNKQEGFVCYLYDTENIYKISQMGLQTNYEFEYSVYYPHNLGIMPAWKLRGIPKKNYGKNPCYQSYFIGAVPHLNKALKLDSTLDGSINRIAYPIRAYYEQKCEAAGCNSGRIESVDGSTKCTSCGGNGRIRFSPFTDYIHKMPSSIEDTPSAFPGFAYVSPDSGILTFNADKIDADILKAFTFINIDMSSAVNANGAEETATQIRIDREEFYSFLLTFSNEIYDLFWNFTWCCAAIKFGEEIPIKVSPPKTFDLITKQELTDELANTNLPMLARKNLVRDYYTHRFSQQSDVVRIAEIVDIVDPYSYKTTTELLALKAANAVQLWQVVLHEEIQSYIDELMFEDEDFLDKELPIIKTALVDKAKARASEMTGATAPRSASEIVTGLA